MTPEELDSYCADLAKAATEHAEQRAFFAWLAYQKFQGAYPFAHLVFAIPNGGHRSKASAGRFKAEGVKAGVPDTMYPVPVGCCAGLFVELKAVDGAVASKQKQWHTDLREQRYAVSTCWGWRKAVQCFEDYNACRPVPWQYK